jgi:hypothetical protein
MIYAWLAFSILSSITTYELWFHRDRHGRSFMEFWCLTEDFDRSDLVLNILAFVFGLAGIHELVKDWYMGEHPAPWRKDFDWADYDD